MKLFNYDEATGRILSTMTYPNGYAAELIGIYPDAVYCPDGFLGDDVSHYILDHEAIPRPEMGVELVGNVLSGVPAGGTIEIEGVTYPCDGSDVTLNLASAGTYKLTIACWPYKDTVIEYTQT